MALSWTESKGIKHRLLLKWDRGYLLRHAFCNDNFFPFTVKLVYPKQEELAEHLSQVFEWRKNLIAESKAERGWGYDVVEKEFHYSILGKNSVPTHICVSTLQDAIKLIGKQKELDIFNESAAKLLSYHPTLRGWIAKNPFKVIALGGMVEATIQVLAWFAANKERDLYIRQIDIDGIDTKFIEDNRAILNELLTETLPHDLYHPEEAAFERRYGLRKKPELVRLRFLDTRVSTHGITDITVPISELKRNILPFRRIFITENEINFLSFPEVRDACIFFGKGYGVDILRELPSISEKEVFYWGDIDTHGFNILSRARSFMPQVKSFLMTEAVLLAHKRCWVREDKPFLSPIPQLTDAEYGVACKLQANHFGKGVRLEQERILFSYVLEFLTSLGG